MLALHHGFWSLYFAIGCVGGLSVGVLFSILVLEVFVLLYDFRVWSVMVLSALCVLYCADLLLVLFGCLRLITWGLCW